MIPACGDGPGSHSAPQTDSQNPAVAATGQPPVNRIVSPESGATRTEGSKIAIKAVATDPDGVIERVEFYDDNRLIGSKSDPPYTLSTGRLKAGTHVLCAVAVGFDGSTTASSPVTLFVVREDDDRKGD